MVNQHSTRGQKHKDGVKISSSTNSVGTSGQINAKKKKMKFDHQLTPYRKLNSRWIKDLNISCNTIKILEVNTVWNISYIPCSIIFINMSLRAKDIKKRTNKWDFIKLKSVCIAKENTSKIKR